MISITPATSYSNAYQDKWKRWQVWHSHRLCYSIINVVRQVEQNEILEFQDPTWACSNTFISLGPHYFQNLPLPLPKKTKNQKIILFLKCSLTFFKRDTIKCNSYADFKNIHTMWFSARFVHVVQSVHGPWHHVMYVFWISTSNAVIWNLF